MEKLLKGETLHTKIDEQIVFNQLDHNEYAIWSLLLASGYLKVEQHVIDADAGKEEYNLKITNKDNVINLRKRTIPDILEPFHGIKVSGIVPEPNSDI